MLVECRRAGQGRFLLCLVDKGGVVQVQMQAQVQVVEGASSLMRTVRSQVKASVRNGMKYEGFEGTSSCDDQELWTTRR